MTDNILNFPSKETITPDLILEESKGKYATCVIIGVTSDGQADYSICAEDAAQVVFLLRTLEHMVIANELT